MTVVVAEKFAYKAASHDESSSSSSSSSSNHRRSDNGSTVVQASLNFTNSIVGAGSVGFGGAIAQSGGFLAIFIIVLFGTLAKISCDLVIRMGTTPARSSAAAVREDGRMSKSAAPAPAPAEASSCLSYESLGLLTYGRTGLVAVTVSKFLFCFGCLVAYIVIVKENFAPACRHLIGAQKLNDNMAALILSIVVVLPLSLMRDLTPLARFSALKIVTYIGIILIVMYLYFQLPWTRSTSEEEKGEEIVMTVMEKENDTFRAHWLQVRPSFIPNMGTFVFAFITQHTVNIVYDSLHQQDLQTWNQVSSISLVLATTVMMALGVFVYMTFWEKTESDMFALYPPSFVSVDIARILLCITIMLTYPMPFYSSRELVIVSLLTPSKHHDEPYDDKRDAPNKEYKDDDNFKGETEEDALLMSSDIETNDNNIISGRLLLPGQDHQLKGPYHLLVTVIIWASSVGLALGAPSLGDVLNVVGCIAGSLIGFLLPALFSYRLEGATVVGGVLLVTGVFVGCIGTYYSVVNLIKDTTLFK